MRDEQDLTAVTEAAWTSFRGRLADHVAAMDDDDVVVVEYDLGVELEGASPYVQLIAFGERRVRAEAVGNAYLDEAVALGAEQEDALLDLGWTAPTHGGGGDNFHDFSELRDADRVAVLLVRTLREVYGVPHPAFLRTDGLGSDPLVDLSPGCTLTTGPDDEADEHAADGDDHDHVAGAVVPRSRAHLQELVASGDAVVMRHELLAVPFSGMQLRLLVGRFVEQVDGIAADLVARVGGRRFHDPVPDDDGDHDVAVDGDVDDLAVVGLLELLHLGRPRAATVAGLFDHDRSAIIRQIVRLRTGRQSCGEHDLDDVLTALRKALRLVSDGESRPVPAAPGPRTVQTSLLTDADLGDDTLDVGWPA